MSSKPEVRVFEKKVGDQVKTRSVTNNSGAVAALFDGYVEQTTAPAKPAAAAKTADKPASN